MTAGEISLAGRAAPVAEAARPVGGLTLGEVVAGQLARLLPLYASSGPLATQLPRLLGLLTGEAFDRPAAPPFDGLSFINADGLPFQWVLQSSQCGHGLGFLCEVGRPGTSVAARLDETLGRVRRSCRLLDWPVPSFLDQAATILLPGADEPWPTHWRSAAWFGVAASGRSLVLKPYFNLNRGTCRDRWLRVGWLLKALGRESALVRLCALSSQCSAGSWPMGLALDLRPDGSIGRVKVYFRSEATSPAWLERWHEAVGPADGAAVVRRFLDLFGPTNRRSFPDGAMVVSLEIHPDEKLSLKTDLAVTKWTSGDSELLDAAASFSGQEGASSALAASAGALGLGGTGASDTALLRFVGLGFEPDGSSHLNVYVEPPLTGSPVTAAPPRGRSVSMPQLAAVAVHRGLAALLNAMAYRHWEDFTLPVGRSDAWVTAYILAMLADLPADLRADIRPQLAGPLAWLAERQRPEGGWGFNASVPDDADSTAWAIIALRAWDHTVPEVAPQFLAKCRDGERFCTYPRATSPAAAWSIAAPDVDAVVCRALGLKSNPVVLAATDGLAPAYWWTTPLYTTAMALAGASTPVPAELRQCLARAVPAGSFERALWLRAGWRAGLGVESCARQLAGEQGADGLWPGTARLRLPHDIPGDPRHRIASGVLYSDRRGLFTSATAIASLSLLSQP